MKGLVFAAALLAATAGAQAGRLDDCRSMYDQSAVDWYKGDAFFSNTDFGSVGFTIDGKQAGDYGVKIYVPKAPVACISLPKPSPFLYVVMNNRHADFTRVSYVSFKLYGFTSSRPQNWAHMLYRTGTWKRTAVLAGDPWFSGPVNGRDPRVVSSLEAFFADDTPLQPADFDRQFGTFHGIPDGGDENSWDDLSAMQPDADLIDQPHIAYVFHDLQRVAVTANAVSPGTPPSVQSNRYKYYPKLLLHTFTPLGESETSTILFSFNG